MKKVQFVTTTATFANKARDVLKSYGIVADIKKVQGGTAAGCLFGITVDDTMFKKTQEVLNEQNIRIVTTKEV